MICRHVKIDGVSYVSVEDEEQCWGLWPLLSEPQAPIAVSAFLHGVKTY